MIPLITLDQKAFRRAFYLFLLLFNQISVFAQPASPTNLTANKGPYRISLSWTTVSGSTMYYKVLRGTSAQTLTLLADSLTNTSYLDESATPYNTFFYAIVAFNQTGISNNSTMVSQSSNRIFYVAPTGNSTNFAGESAPVLTIMNAVNRAITGDTILLNPGTYSERILLAGRALTLASRYIFTSNPTFITNTIINGSTQPINDPLIFDNSNSGNGTKNFVGFTITGSRNAAIDVVSTNLKNLRITNCYTQAFTNRNSLILLNGNNCSIDSCEIVNNNTHGPYYFIQYSGSFDFNFTNNRIEGNRFGNFVLYTSAVYAPANRRVSNNRFLNNFSTEADIHLIDIGTFGGTAFQRCIISNNLFAKNNANAINLWPRLGDSIFILNNTFFRNGLGFRLGSDNGRFTKIQNNIFYENYSAFLGGQELFVGSQGIPPPTQKVQFNNNLIGRQDTANPLNYIVNLEYVDTSGSGNNFGGYPEFVDTANNDFRVRRTSNIINAGAAHYYLPTTDLNGLPRPSPTNSNPDIGCFEHPLKFASPVIYASEAGNQSIMIYWRSSKSKGFTKQRVYRSTSPIPDTTVANFLMEISVPTTTEYLDVSQLTNLTTYYYRIRVGDNFGNWSELSNEWTAIPRVPPSNPANFTATKGPRRIGLSWQASIGNTVRYVIFKDTLQNQRRMILDTITTLSYIDSNVVPFKTYYYTIHPIDVFNTKGGFTQSSNFANRIWYVSVTGSNSNRGLENAPYRNITFAYARALEEDTILLEQGTYYDQLTLNTKRLTISSRYLFDRNPAIINNTILDGSQGLGTTRLVTDLSNGNSLGSTKIHRFIGLTLTKSKGLLMELTNVHLQNMIIEDNNTQGTPGFSSLLFLSGANIVDSCIFRNNLIPPYTLIQTGTGFYSNTLKFTNNLFQNNRYENTCLYLGQPYANMVFELKSNKFLQNQSTAAINCVFQYYSPDTNLSKLVIRNNLIARNTGAAMVFTPSVEDSIFINHNTITQNQGGVNFAADRGKYALISNNIFSFNSNQSTNNFVVYGTPVFPKPKVVFRNNLIGNARTNNALTYITNIHYYDTIGSINNVSGIPYFKDSAAGDFTLSNISWGIGKGLITATTPSIDLNGQLRPNPFGSNPDIGAFESQYKTIAPRLDSINTQNSLVRMVWFADSADAKQYDIYRGTSLNNLSLLTRITNNLLQVFVDSFPVLQTRNYYAFYAISKSNDTSGISNILSAIPLAQPSLVNPQNNQTKVGRTLTFTWQRNTEAANYRFVLSRSRDFLTLINKDTTTADTFYRQTINLLFNTKYYWRVRTINSTGFSVWRTDSFQTLVRAPQIDSLNSRFERVWLRWNDGAATGIYKYVVTRINTANNDVKIDSINAGTYIHIDSTTLTGIRYQYRVQAMNPEAVLSDYSNSRFVIPLRAPILAEPTNNSISSSRTPTLTWEKYPFATSFRIQASLNQNFSVLDVDTIRPDSFYRYHKLMQPNAFYYWRVMSRDSLGFSNFSVANGFQTELSVPNLFSITTNNNVLRLNWFDTAATSVAGYQIFRSTTQGASTLLTTLPGGVFEFYDSTVNNGTQYFYRIKSVSSQQLTSNFSRELSATPYAIVNGLVANRGPRRVQLTWNASTQSNIMYEIFRKRDAQSFTLLVDSLTNNQYLDLNLIPGSTYQYMIRTRDVLNNPSEFSLVATSTPNQIWHVDTAGNNNNWGSEISKLKTISFAIQQANLGDTLILSKGTYNERINLTGKELTIASQYLLNNNQTHADSTFIDGNNLGSLPLISDAQNKRFNLVGLHITKAAQIAVTSNSNAQNRVNIINCIVSQSGTTFTNGVINISNGEILKTTLRNCSASVLLNAGNHIQNTRLTISQTKMFNNVSSGSLVQSNYAALVNNLFNNNTAIAVVANNVSADANDSALILINNTIANNNAIGMQVGGSPIIIADNNIVIGNSVSQIAYAGQSGLAILRFRNNIIRGYDTVNVPSTFTRFSTNNLDTLPVFANTVNGDYSLVNFSVGLGSGINNFNINTDILGNTRPLPANTNPDIGAFENVNGFSGPALSNISSSPNGISLVWTSNTAGISSFKIYRGLSPDNMQVIATVNSSNNSYIDNTAATQTMYYYAISSITNQSVESGLSNVLSSVMLNSPLLVEPGNNQDSTTLNPIFKWNKLNYATVYRMQLALNSNFTQTIIDTVLADTSVLVINLNNNTSYYWRVRGQLSNGIGSWSVTRNFETVVRTPSISNITTANQSVTLTWSDNNQQNINRYVIYRGLSKTALTVLTLVNSGNYIYTDNTVLNDTVYYYAIAAINNNQSGSILSDTLQAIPLERPVLLLPLNPAVFVSVNNANFKWSKSIHQVNYQFQISTSEQFTTITKDTIIPDTLVSSGGLNFNTNYWWRVRALNNTGSSNWSVAFKIQTMFQNAVFDSIIAGNKNNKLYWSHPNTNGIVAYRIERDTSAVFNNYQVIAIVSGGNTFQFTDNNLLNGKNYYYMIYPINFDSILGSGSNMLNGKPFNKKPTAAPIAAIKLASQGRLIFNNHSISDNGSFDSDGVIDSLVWFVNGNRIGTGNNLNYGFRQGTSIVTLKVFDNDQAVDTTFTFIDVLAWERAMKGPIRTGLSAANANMIYAVDENFVGGLGSEMRRFDSIGNGTNSVTVNNRITATPCITPDTSLLITNGANLDGYNKFNNPKWPTTIQLGGTTTVTATIDSTLERIYLGVSTGNFNAYNYNTGGALIWSFTTDNAAPIRSSAVITADRKLIFPDALGKMYGFDVSTSSSHSGGPKWRYSGADLINTSPAIDNSGFVYVGTENGKLKKFEFKSNGDVSEIWSANLGSSPSNSPVIDANGFIYIGCVNGTLYKVDPISAFVRGSFNTGDTIKSTPAISGRGKLYVASVNGMLNAIDTTMNRYWYYKDSSAIIGNVLYTGNTVYVGTMGGRVLAFWDYDLPFGRKKAEPEKDPMWGTFQGNAQRTGAKPPADTSSNVWVKPIQNQTKIELEIYPNPNNGLFNITTKNTTIEQVEIMDSQGKISLINHFEDGFKEVEIRTNGLASGVYLCKIITKKGVSIQRIVIAN
jgi:fibronectin type 3 domain-containing protein